MSSWLYALIPAAGVGLIYVIRKLRERQWGWVRSTASLKDKIYIITGANTGLGFETTLALVARHATVIMACRDMNKANDAISRLQAVVSEGKLVI